MTLSAGVPSIALIDEAVVSSGLVPAAQPPVASKVATIMNVRLMVLSYRSAAKSCCVNEGG
jgi:hypothetical protein